LVVAVPVFPAQVAQLLEILGQTLFFLPLLLLAAALVAVIAERH
jgi:hypothetical protein